MNLDDYLIKHQLRRLDIVDAAVERLGFCEPDDMLLFAGSLVSGEGNGSSDVDLYLITDRDLPVQFHFTNTIILTVKTTIVDIEVYRWGFIDTLLQQIQKYPANTERDFRETICISPGNAKLLHALSIAECAKGDQLVFQRLQAVDKWALARILMDRSLAHIYSMKSDIKGVINSGDVEVSRYLLVAYYWHIVNVILSMTGYTNPSEKWRVKYYENLKSNTEAFLKLLMGHHRIASYFHNALPPGAWNSADLVQQFQCLTYISNIVIPLAQYRMLSTIQYENCPLTFSTAKPAIRNESASAQKIMPQLHSDTLLRYSSDGFMITRPDRAPAQNLNPIAFQFLVFFDGESSLDEAVQILVQNTDLSEAEIIAQFNSLYNYLLYNRYL